ncbi:MAG: hypothetical protein HC910_22985 [Spirulinaceae cyanobacterium SM2_1_0]|nr:hypothetical protein [Spirulinaceae cyanobacterium SM2_1_0]
MLHAAAINLFDQQAFWQQGDRTFQHPYYWAGFATIGNPWSVHDLP